MTWKWTSYRREIISEWVKYIEDYFSRNPTLRYPISNKGLQDWIYFLNLHLFTCRADQISDWIHNEICERILARSTLTPRQKIAFLEIFSSCYMNYWGTHTVAAFNERKGVNIDRADFIEFIWFLTTRIKLMTAEVVQRWEDQSIIR